jgi:hypothetical protein
MSLVGTATMTATELVEQDFPDTSTGDADSSLQGQPSTNRRQRRAPRQRFKPRAGLRGAKREDARVIAHLASSGMIETQLLGPRIRAKAAALCEPCADNDPWCPGCLIVEPEYGTGHGPYRSRSAKE